MVYLLALALLGPIVLIILIVKWGLFFGVLGVKAHKNRKKKKEELAEGEKMWEETSLLSEDEVDCGGFYGDSLSEEDIFPTIDEEDTVNLPIVREQVVNKTITEVDGVIVEETQSEITILSDDRIIIKTNGKETIVIKQDGDKQTIIINK